MNRTQRTIRRQYRESEAAMREKKNKEIQHRQSCCDRPLVKSKKDSADQVKKYQHEREEYRKMTIDYKKRVLSEKNTKEYVEV